jgi:hypothetical protein
MADDSEFITKLIGFGLSEKEAQLYLHLLRYGPKPRRCLRNRSRRTGKTSIVRSTVLIIKAW